MATYLIQPQKLVDYIAAGNALPPFLAGNIQVYLAGEGIAAAVSVAPDGTVTIETEATEAEVRAALAGITPEDLDPGRVKETTLDAIMVQLDAYADAVDGGQTPTIQQTQQAVAGLVRVVHRLREHQHGVSS